MKRKSLSLALALAMVLLMSFGIVAHAETTTGNAKDILLTDGERTFEEDTVNVLEEGLYSIYLKATPVDEIKELSYVFDEGLENEYGTTMTDNITESIKFKSDFVIGKTHTVRCTAKYNDGTSLEKFYTFDSIARHKNYDQLCVNVSLNGECMYQENYYTLRKNDVISVDVKTFFEDLPVCFTAYYWADADTWQALTEEKRVYGEDGEHFVIEVPEEYYGTRKALMIESVLETNEGKEDQTRRSGWMIYFLNLGNNVSADTRLNGEKLYSNYSHLVRNGDKITISGIPLVDSEIDFIGYYFLEFDEKTSRWSNTGIIRAEGATAQITLPDREPGSVMYLYVEPVDMLDNSRTSYVTKSGWQLYMLVWCDDTPIPEKETIVTYSGCSLDDGSNIEVKFDDYLRLSATSAERIEMVYFTWDDEPGMQVWQAQYYDLKIPSEFAIGSTHKLQVNVLYNNGEESAIKTFHLTVLSYDSEDNQSFEKNSD